MSSTATKRAIEEKQKPKKSRELVFDAPHIFRVKSEQSLAHLRESRQFASCVPCIQESNRREQASLNRPTTASTNRSRPSTGPRKKAILPPSAADLERLSRPKTVSEVERSNNCNWNNFIRKKSKYAIRSPFALCDPIDANEVVEKRPPFVNYGGRYDDKSYGEKRTYNSLAIHQMKHHQVQEQRVVEAMRERRLRLQAENYFREMEARRAREQDLRDRAARSSTEYRDNYRPPANYELPGTFARH